MEVVNPFILKNKERMVVYLDQLSAIGDPGNNHTNSLHFPTSSSSNLANIDTGMKYFFYENEAFHNYISYKFYFSS